MTQSTPNKRRIIDVWAQPPGKSFTKALPEVRDLFVASHSPVEKWLKKEDSDFLKPSTIVNQMNDGDIDKLMLCGWNRPNKVIVSNETVLKYTQAYPNRFCGVVSIDLNNPLKSLSDIDYYVKKHKFKAVRVVPWLWDKPITHRYYYPIFVKCIELDIPFCTQVGHTGPLCPSEVGRPVPYVDRVALDFPQLKIVCGHTGYPWISEMIGVAWKHRNVFIDTSAWLPAYYPKELMHYANSYGSHKVMFGTNYPQLTLEACANQAKKLKLKPKNLEKFLYKNAIRVFKLDSNQKKNEYKNSKL